MLGAWWLLQGLRLVWRQAGDKVAVGCSALHQLSQAHKAYEPTGRATLAHTKIGFGRAPNSKQPTMRNPTARASGSAHDASGRAHMPHPDAHNVRRSLRTSR
eukprot:3929011-Prymnesium_polylepis.1